MKRKRGAPDKKSEAAVNLPAVTIRAMAPIDAMIQSAIESKVAVENLEKLLTMRRENERYEAEKRFHEEFCKMQGEFPIIKRRKEVRDYGGKVVYKYAPLEDIIREIQPVLAKHGFAYSWNEVMDPAVPDVKRIVCKISGYGHSESAHVDIPIMDATKMTNSAQQAGSSSTYGKRYSLMGILGIMCDDDDDGRGAVPAPEPKTTTVVDEKGKEVIIFEEAEMTRDERIATLKSIDAKARELKWTAKDLKTYIKNGWKTSEWNELPGNSLLAIDQAMDVEIERSREKK